MPDTTPNAQPTAQPQVSQPNMILGIVVGVAVAIVAMLVLAICGGAFAFYFVLRSEVAPPKPPRMPVPIEAPAEESPPQIPAE